AAQGDTADVLNQYLAEGAGRVLPGVPVETLRITPRGGNLDAVFTHVTCTSDNPLTRGQPFTGGPLRVEVELEARRGVRFNSLCVSLFDRNRTRLIAADTIALGDEPIALEPGTHQLAVMIPELHLRPGVYGLGVCLAHRPVAIFDNCETVGDLEVVPAPGHEHDPKPSFDGPVSCEVEWLN